MTIANYEFNCLGRSLVSIDEHGTIVRTELPFNRFIGKKLSAMERELQERHPNENVGVKFLGYTKDRPLTMKGSPDAMEK
jgi:hypothetical protein